MLTARPELRLPVETDRPRFVELFQQPSFMVFAGVDSLAGANTRFDRLLRNAADLPFAKQPVIERATGRILGYCGVAWFDFEGDQIPEFGYRLCVDARGNGYATEAGQALVDLARASYQGSILAMIDPANHPSMRVIDKLGCPYWKQAQLDGYLTNLYRLELP